nr:sodium:proton antiporter NhaD [Bacteroidota bacterium]
ELVTGQLEHQLGDVAGILFFLLGAMTIVELIDMHDGFSAITSRIHTTNKVKLLWVIALLSFFLSAVLDNLTTAIVMASLIKKLIPEKQLRMMFAGMVIIACNAGGAWSPIGDVTTTMLWIDNRITTPNIIATVFLPSLACLLVPLAALSFKLKGSLAPVVIKESRKDISVVERNTVFIVGLLVMLFVPVFKTITHLHPFMGILFGLGVLWVVTELMHKGKKMDVRSYYSPAMALQRIDAPSILFFLGILTAVGALQAVGVLNSLAVWMDSAIGNLDVVVLAIGLLSAIVDNVPMVAATMGMYSLEQYPVDHRLWEFIAYCAGTGGSILIIGSASGVAVMGLEKIEFFWYLRKIGWLALLGYIAGAGVYLLQASLIG